ncbi:MAG: hypothetical protein ACREO2_07865, partial [Arenimonas sp.]
EAVWGDKDLVSMLDESGFLVWWKRLLNSDISAQRLVQLLALIPCSQFSLSDVLAWASASTDDKPVSRSLGREDWIAAYGQETQSNQLPIASGRIALPHRAHVSIDESTIRRLWPSITIKAFNFPDILAEHCKAWRALSGLSNSAPPPLEYLLMTDPYFEAWLCNSTAEPESALKAMLSLFHEPEQGLWSASAWLKLLEQYLSKSKRGRPHNPIKVLRKRLMPLLIGYSPDENISRVKALIAASLGLRSLISKANLRLSNLAPPTYAEAMVDSIRWITKIRVQRAAQRIESFKTVDPERLSQRNAASIEPEIWAKILGNNDSVPESWKLAHQGRWQP